MCWVIQLGQGTSSEPLIILTRWIFLETGLNKDDDLWKLNVQEVNYPVKEFTHPVKLQEVFRPLDRAYMPFNVDREKLYQGSSNRNLSLLRR